MALRAISNPPNPYHSSFMEWLDCDPVSSVKIFEEEAKSIISKNKSPDVGFEYSINPYRGCFHACSYCYARPSHQYLDFGAGSDFESKLVVKVNAAELLRKEFMKPSWKGSLLIFSGNTDCYQPLEVNYRLTRKCLEVCKEFRNPVAIITKGALIRRDLDLLSQINEVTNLQVYISVAFIDDAMSKLVEPQAPRPSKRFAALKELARAGISSGVALAPVIPGLNHDQIGKILERAKSCGAKSAFMTLLRLPAEVKDVFLENLALNFPTRYDRVLNQLKQMRYGKLNRSQFGERMRGKGKEWEAIHFLFKQSCKKLGLNLRDYQPDRTNTFVRPSKQLNIFGMG